MITVPSQHTESQVAVSTTRPSLTVAQLIRWSGLVNILAGILYALETLLHPARDITKLAAITQQSVLGVSWPVSHTLGIAAGLLGLIGLTGLYVRQFDKLDWLGLAGFVTALIGTAMLAGSLVPDAYVFPALGSRAATPALLSVPGPFGAYWAFVAASGLLFVLGTAIFSIAGVRTGLITMGFHTDQHWRAAGWFRPTSGECSWPERRGDARAGVYSVRVRAVEGPSGGKMNRKEMP